MCVRDPKIFVWQRCFAFLCAALRCFALLGSPPFTFFKIQDPYTPGWVVCTSSIYVPRGPSKHPCRLWAEAVQEHRGLQNPARREGKGAVPHCLLCLLFLLGLLGLPGSDPSPLTLRCLRALHCVRCLACVALLAVLVSLCLRCVACLALLAYVRALLACLLTVLCCACFAVLALRCLRYVTYC